MILFVQNLVKMADRLVEPTLTIPAIPPSDNRRKTRNPHTGQIVTSGDIAKFKSHVFGAISAANIILPKPPVVVLYRMYFKTKHRRDNANGGKALIDALYSQDYDVVGWALPYHYHDKVDPRTEVWIVEIEDRDQTSVEALHKQIKWIGSQQTGNV